MSLNKNYFDAKFLLEKICPILCKPGRKLSKFKNIRLARQTKIQCFWKSGFTRAAAELCTRIQSLTVSLMRKKIQSYTAVYLENRYLKIMILPELGGRVQMALDKTNGYHFVYYNQVIKPALVGLAGPWISGGIEFNWPQHHRPSTFDPLDWRIETHEDGSRTVWCAEIEKMFRTKGMHGFTLYPERAYLEIRVQLYNRTSEPQTFLWWANPAVTFMTSTQSVFPPDVHAVMDHGKRDVSSFPDRHRHVLQS